MVLVLIDISKSGELVLGKCRADDVASIYALFSKVLFSRRLSLSAVSAPHVTQGLIARHFPGTEHVTILGKRTLRNLRLTPCIASKD